MCAAVLKNWREAATLMLVHCRKKVQQKATKELHPSNVLTTEALQQATPTGPPEDSLEVLTLKRSSKSSFMPDLYVFPGGTADDADFSQSWLALFDAVTPEKAKEKFGFCKTVSQNAPMFHRKRDPDFASVPSEVAFRITAIRETFEESGVLIARGLGQSDSQYNSKATLAFTFGKTSELEEWRRKVMGNPVEFLTLCKNLEIVPDIWSLYDWSNWLTPLGSGEASGKRFDAAFFVCCLKEHPYVAEDKGELVHSKWVSPTQMVVDYRNRKAQLAPPQYYEASRLINFNNMEELMKFLQSRVGQPVDRWMPVRIQCADGIMFVFPGDCLYPKEPDFEGEAPVLVREETLQELLKKSDYLHRAVAFLPAEIVPGSAPLFQLQCNISQLPHGHVPPAALV